MRYGKDQQWEQWMLDTRERYAIAFQLQKQRTWPVNVDVRYLNDIPPPYA